MLPKAKRSSFFDEMNLIASRYSRCKKKKKKKNLFRPKEEGNKEIKKRKKYKKMETTDKIIIQFNSFKMNSLLYFNLNFETTIKEKKGLKKKKVNRSL